MTSRPWTIHQPGPLTARGEHLWTIDDLVPGMPVNRRMTIVRRDDGTLLFFNAIPVPDDTLAAIQKLGTPTALVVPNHFHAMDAAAFTQKLNVTAYMPDVAITALADRLKGHRLSELPRGDDVQVFTVEGFKTNEVVLFTRTALITADLVTNVANFGGAYGLMMRLIGFTGPRPTLPPPVRFRVGKDKALIRARLEQLATLNPSTLIPSHGAVFTGDVATELRHIAGRL
ncbi:MAG: hypothetical protein ACO1OB_28570 [Archangium sp.]